MTQTTGSVPRTLAATMNEKEWQELVLHFARLHDWWCFHPYDSKKSAPGWPDLVMIRPPEFVVVELKTDKGTVTDSQRQVLAALEECGIEAHLWRPSDEAEVFERLKRGGVRKARLTEPTGGTTP